MTTQDEGPKVPTVTEEVSTQAPSPAITQSVETEADLEEEVEIPDEWESITPFSGELLFYYYAEPQSEADLAINRLVDHFNDSNPFAISINAFNMGTPAGVLSRTLPLVGDSALPPLLMTNADLVLELGNAGGLVDLEGLMMSQTWGYTAAEREEMLVAIFESAQLPWFDETYTFPISGEAFIQLYNTDWMIETGTLRIPRTPGEFERLVCAASQRPFRLSGSLVANGYQFRADFPTMMSWALAYGAEVFDPEFSGYRFDAPESIQALAFLQDLASRGCIQPQQDLGDAPQSFRAGLTASVLTGNSRLGEYVAAADANLKFEWAVSRLPSPTGSAAPVFVSVGPGLSIGQTSSERELAAWLFIKFTQSLAAQEIWGQATGQIPVFRNIALEALPKPSNQLLIGWLQDSPIIPVQPGNAEIVELAESAFESILNGANPEATLTRLTQQISTIVTTRRGLQ